MKKVLIVSVITIFFINFIFTGHVFALQPSNLINSFVSIFDQDSTALIPEPATMFLLGIGLIGIAGFGRKKLFKK